MKILKPIRKRCSRFYFENLTTDFTEIASQLNAIVDEHFS